MGSFEEIYTVDSLSTKFQDTIRSSGNILAKNQILAVEDLAAAILEGLNRKTELEKPFMFSLIGLSGTGKSYLLDLLTNDLEELGLRFIGDCTSPVEVFESLQDEHWGAVRIAPVQIGEISDREARLTSAINDSYEEHFVVIRSVSPNELRLILAEDSLIVVEELDRVVSKSLGSIELAKLLLDAPFKFPGRENAEDVVIAGFIQRLCPPDKNLPYVESITEQLETYVNSEYELPDFTKIPIRTEDENIALVNEEDEVVRLIELGLTFKDDSTWERYTKFAKAYGITWNKNPRIVVTACLDDTDQYHSIFNYFADIERFGFSFGGIGKCGLIFFKRADQGEHSGYDIDMCIPWNGTQWFPEVIDFNDQKKIVSGAPYIAQLAVGGHSISDKSIVLPSVFESHLQNQGILYHVYYPHNAGQANPYSYLLYDPEKESCSDLGFSPENGSITF